MDTNSQAEHFSRETSGLPEATATQTIDLADGDTYELVAAPVRRRIGDAEVRLLGCNGSVPGPTLRVRQGSTVTVTFTNRTDLESTVHWHGLRLENRFDGTLETQAPIPIGKRAGQVRRTGGRPQSAIAPDGSPRAGCFEGTARLFTYFFGCACPWGRLR